MYIEKIYTFICDNCGHIFEKLIGEGGPICKLFVDPQECPECGSFHTMPKDGYLLFDRTDYEKNWLEEDKNRQS